MDNAIRSIQPREALRQCSLENESHLILLFDPVSHRCSNTDSTEHYQHRKQWRNEKLMPECRENELRQQILPDSRVRNVHQGWAVPLFVQTLSGGQG